MGVDLATILAVMGTVWTGNPLSLNPSFSIGGRDTGVNNLLDNIGGLLGQYRSPHSSHPRLTVLYRRAPGTDWLAQLHRIRLFQHPRRSVCDWGQLPPEHGQVHGVVQHVHGRHLQHGPDGQARKHPLGTEQEHQPGFLLRAGDRPDRS